MSSKKKVDKLLTRKRSPLEFFGARIEPHYLEEAQFYAGGYSQFIREAVISYGNNRHKHKFIEILELISGELLILSAWKEKGHPGGQKWTDKEEIQLQYYQRCWEILQNSPFSEKD